MIARPWSNSQLKRLSACIRDELPVPDGVPQYREVMLWYNDVAVDVLGQLSEMDWSPLLGDRPVEIGSRAKTLDMLRQKLRRDRTTPLAFVQDVAGVRFEAEMSLDEQDAVAGAIAGMFGHDQHSIKDPRSSPHSGYRAVHVWLRTPVRVEVQVRTHMQGEWANMYEAAADVFGRDIRYGEMPVAPLARDVVEALTRLSEDTIGRVERGRHDVERALLGLREAGGAEVPLFDHQVEARLTSERERRLSEEDMIRRSLREIHDQFRAMQRKV